MRLGPLLGFEQSFETVVTVAREMEAVGAGSVMLAEAGRSAVTQASAVIAATESIEVGTYVMNAFARSPFRFAACSMLVHDRRSDLVKIDILMLRLLYTFAISTFIFVDCSLLL